jgi:hypothetical protein
LATVGALAGLVLAFWGINWLLAAAASSLPRQQEVSFDMRVFVVASLATIVAGIATGLVPALQLVKPA